MPVDRLVERLRDCGYAVRRVGKGWQAQCSAHDDPDPSLSISEGVAGQALLHCHAGCTNDTILTALGLTSRDLFPENSESATRQKRHHRVLNPACGVRKSSKSADLPVSDGSSKKNASTLPAVAPKEGAPVSQHPEKKEIVAIYDYRDLGGKVIHQTVRYWPKNFKQRRPDGKGGLIWNLDGIEPVLFRLPEITKSIQDGLPIYLVGGEKDVLAMVKHGFCATCNPQGEGKWRDSYTKVLRGADVIIIADKDQAGRKHAQLVASKLYGIARSVRVLELPDQDATPVKDASDFFAAGGDAGGLKALFDDTEEWMPEEPPIPYRPPPLGLLP